MKDHAESLPEILVLCPVITGEMSTTMELYFLDEQFSEKHYGSYYITQFPLLISLLVICYLA